MLRAKVHRIRVTECDVEYEGSISLDSELMRAADLLPYERIEVYDVDNGQRFATYLIEGAPGSGECCVNGAAARLVEVGHRLILAAYAVVEERELDAHRPRLVLIGPDNRVRRVAEGEAPRVRFADRLEQA
jgi:aspartate 1-decarboxylase